MFSVISLDAKTLFYIFPQNVMYTRAYTPNVIPLSAQTLGSTVTEQFNHVVPQHPDEDSRAKNFKKVLFQISSSQRLLSLNPSPSDFEVRIPKPISDVYSARILQCTLPSSTVVTSSPTIYILVNDFNNVSNTDGTQYYTSMSFPVTVGSTGFAHLNTTAMAGIFMDQNTPRQLKRVDKFKVQLFNSLGQPLALPDETSINAANQVNVLVELTILEH
jgi:hypothetical protein